MRLPNGFGSIHKLSGNRRNPWRVRKTIGKTPDGKMQYINIGYYPTRAEAFKSLAEFNNDPWDIKSNKITFGEIYETILKQKEKTLSEASFRMAKSTYKHTASIQNLPIADIKTHHLQKVIDDLDKSKVVKLKVKGIYNDVFKYALKNDIVKRDYASLVEVGKSSTEKRKIEIFTLDEIKKVNAGIGVFNHDLTMLLICTGFRINELLTLKTADIDLDKGIMIGGSKTDAGKERIVPISRHIRPIIERYFNARKDFLLINSRGKNYTPDNARKYWNPDYPNHHFHECRHTFASLCNNSGMTKLAQQKIMGHTPADITDRVYTHKTADDLIKQMGLFDKHLDGILRPNET